MIGIQNHPETKDSWVFKGGTLQASEEVYEFLEIGNGFKLMTSDKKGGSFFLEV